jgi:ubiquinone/menaquinone biosynthesis C-methylase UbiE
MSNHYTAPSQLMRAAYRLVYDPLRAGYLRRLVDSFDLTGTERVLDFGSGAGSEAIYLARALQLGGRLTCLDVSPAWLAEARRRLRGYENVEFVLGEAADLALPVAEFDLIVAHFVLHDVDRASLPPTLAALVRSLRPGGRFIAVEPDPLPGRGLVPAHHRFAPHELDAAMAQAGLVEDSREIVRPLFGSAVRTVFRKEAPPTRNDALLPAADPPAADL